MIKYGPRIIDRVHEVIPLERDHAIPFSEILSRLSGDPPSRSNVERSITQLVRWGLAHREKRRVVHGPGRVLNQFVYWRDS